MKFMQPAGFLKKSIKEIATPKNTEKIEKIVEEKKEETIEEKEVLSVEKAKEIKKKRFIDKLLSKEE